MSGLAITNPDSGWYYGSKQVTGLPSGATAISMNTTAAWDANVNYALNNTDNTIIAKCPVSKTLGNNRYVKIYYFV